MTRNGVSNICSFQLCKGIDQSGAISSGVIGRRAVTPPPPVNGCVQCCNLHGCNKNLCPVQTITRAPLVSKYNKFYSKK